MLLKFIIQSGATWRKLTKTVGFRFMNATGVQHNLFNCSEVIVLTNKHTNKQRDSAFCWKHPPLSTMIRRWKIILLAKSVAFINMHAEITPLSTFTSSMSEPRSQWFLKMQINLTADLLCSFKKELLITYIVCLRPLITILYLNHRNPCGVR